MAPQTITRDERLALIESHLFHNPDGLRVVELAASCDVDRRTIYRDLAQLRANGVPVFRQDGRFFISRDYYLASVRFSIHEIIALFAAARVMAQVAPRQSPHMISAIKRLGEALPATIASHIQQTATYLRQQPVDRLFVAVLETLTRAWREQRRVHIWYGHHFLDFAPYFLEVKADGSWYVLGVNETTEHIQALHLRRITRAELQDTTFKRPHKFDSTTYLSGDFETLINNQTSTIEITLAASPQATRQITRDRQPITLHDTPKEDEREIISFTAPNWQGLLPWLRAFGPQIEVLTPLDLRTQLRQEAEQTLARHQ